MHCDKSIVRRTSLLVIINITVITLDFITTKSELSRSQVPVI